MPFEIRLFRDGDAERLAEVCLAAINVVGQKGYGAEQVEAWAARHGGPDSYRQGVTAGHTIVVAVDEADMAVAYALIEPDGHVDRLYNHPDYTRLGLAGRLLLTVEKFASDNGIQKLFTEASVLARPAFERAGYTVMHRRDFEIAHNGNSMKIHNFAMEKPLT